MIIVVQSDAFNRSALRTVVCVPLTNNVRWAESPGNVLLPARSTRLDRDSVAMVAQAWHSIAACWWNASGDCRRQSWSWSWPGIDIVLGRD